MRYFQVLAYIDLMLLAYESFKRALDAFNFNARSNCVLHRFTYFHGIALEA